MLQRVKVLAILILKLGLNFRRTESRTVGSSSANHFFRVPHWVIIGSRVSRANFPICPTLPTMAEDGEQRQILVRPLQTNDIPFVVAFEQASFPPNEAATPEKVRDARLGTSELMGRLNIVFERVLK